MHDEMKGCHFLGSERVQVMKNWRRAMLALSMLWQDLQDEGYDYFPVGAINHDCLENYNSTMRVVEGHRHNPSVADFPSTFFTGLITT